MSKKVYVVYNSGISQDNVDAISVHRFKEMTRDGGEIYNYDDFVNKVIKEGWDKSKQIAKIIEEKDVSSLDYLEFTSKEKYEIRKAGFPGIDGVDLINIDTHQNLIRIAKYYGGIFCLTYYDKRYNMVDSILMDDLKELCNELKFFADEEKKYQEEEE